MTISLQDANFSSTIKGKRTKSDDNAETLAALIVIGLSGLWMLILGMAVFHFIMTWVDKKIETKKNNPKNKR